MIREQGKSLAFYIQKIEELKQWIREEGIRSNICTFNILREVCSNCECGRKDKK